jgi:hypothetical protein
MTKQKRRLEPVFNDNGVFRFQANEGFWFKDSPIGPEFHCDFSQCPQRTHILTLYCILEIINFLSLHQDKLWNVLCEDHSEKVPSHLIMALPGAGYEGKHPAPRLVSVIWPTDGILTFVS